MITYNNSGAFGLRILFRLHGSAVFKSCTPALLSSIIYVILYRYSPVSVVAGEENEDDDDASTLLADPYPMAALVAAFSFLLIFRANFSYNRYWEAHTAIHAMHGKWLDVATELAAFHLQAACYQPFQPPSFGGQAYDEKQQYPPTTASAANVNVNQQHHQQQRQPRDPLTQQELEHQIDAQIVLLEQENSRSNATTVTPPRSRFHRMQELVLGRSSNSNSNSNRRTVRLFRRRDTSSSNSNSMRQGEATATIQRMMASEEENRQFVSTTNNETPASPRSHSRQQYYRGETSRTVHFGTSSASIMIPHDTKSIKDTNTKVVVDKHQQRHHRQQQQNTKRERKEQNTFGEFFDPKDQPSPYSRFWNHARQRLEEGHLDPAQGAPIPYFLETVAHLLSLMSAVSLSTLRNDLEGAESPLAEFRPNVPWPHVDPDKYRGSIRNRWYQSEYRAYTLLRYLCGLTRTDHARRRYNLGRPFRVIGNVSDSEIQALQSARGPQAKVTLVSLWLQELITREFMAGAAGNVAPPIFSRIYQFTSDGMAGYNQARKIAYIPFPFPHAQITTLFVLVTVAFIPILMLTYVNNAIFGFFWNLVTVMCFTGLHEVARELENPFQTVPNEIPLNHFQAQFNEGLMVMFFGYHPDAYWLVTGSGADQDGGAHGGDTTSVASNQQAAGNGATTVIPGPNDNPASSSSTSQQMEKEFESVIATIKEDDLSNVASTPPRVMMERHNPIGTSPLQMSSFDESMLEGHEESIAAYDPAPSIITETM